MDFLTILDIYSLISNTEQGVSSRKAMSALRKAAFKDSQMVKVAFDTRRINQEDEYNPRRGLQNYHRSEDFVSPIMLDKIRIFAKLSKVLEEIKAQFGKSSEWQDSYSRVLLSSVSKGLRLTEKDGDFSENQPALGSLDYLEELMYVRYRLTPELLNTKSSEEIKSILLSKDPGLISNGIDDIIRPSDVNKFSYETMIDKIITKTDAPRFDNYEMMEKMFINMATLMSKVKPDLTSQLFDVKATSDNPDVERTITINIKDKVNKEGE